MIGYLGSLTVALANGIKLWEQHDPLSSLHRDQGLVPRHKHRSQHRAETLRTARRLFHLIERWNQTFGEKFFPRFATRPRAP